MLDRMAIVSSNATGDQSIEGECTPANRKAFSRAKRTRVANLSFADLAAATGDVIKSQRREILERVRDY